MARIFEVNFKLGAQIAASFSSSFKSARGAMDALKTGLGGVSKEANDIKALLRQQQAVERTKDRYERLSNQSKDLAREMSKIDPAAKGNATQYANMARQLDRLNREVHGAEVRLNSERSTLAQLDASLNKAGRSTDELRARQAQLARQADKARAAQARLAGAIADRDANSARMSSARGNLMEAAAIGASLAIPIKQSMMWEQSLAELNKVADLTPNQLQAISRSAQDMAVQTGVAREEIIGAYTAAAQAGFARDEWAQFAEVSAKMGVAFDTTGDHAGEMLRNWRAGMGLTMKEAELMAASANHLANNMNANATDIGEVLQKQGSILKTAGFDAAESAALAATILSSGMDASSAGTAIKNFSNAFTRGEATSGRAAKGYEMLGMDPEALAKQMQEAPQEVLTSVLEGIKNLEAHRQSAAMSMIFGEEAVAGISPLLSNLDNLKNAFALVGDETKYAASLQAEFDAMGNTSLQNSKKLAEQMKVITTLLGDALKPALTGVMDALMPVLKSVSDWMQENPKLVGGIAMVAAAVGALTVGILLTTYVVTAMKAAYLSVRVAILAVRGAMAAATLANAGNTASTVANTVSKWASAIASKAAALWNGIQAAGTWALTTAQWALNAAFIASPIGWIVLGIGALVAAGILLYKNWDKISSWWSETWTKIKDIAGNAWTSIKEWFSSFSLFDSGKAIFQTLIDGLKSMGGALLDTVTGAFSKVRDMLPFSDAKTGPFSELTASGAAIMQTLGAGIKSVGASPLMVPFAAAADTLIGGPMALGESLGSAASRLVGGGGGGIQLTVNQTINLNGASPELGEEAANGARVGMSDMLSEIEKALERKKRLSYG